MDFGNYIDREGPMSSIDLAFQRTRGGLSTSRGGAKRTSTGRPRGRPPKKPRKEELDPSDTSESEAEEVFPESAEQSSGDENDPDWRVGQKDDIPKKYKTFQKVHYSIKTPMQAEWASKTTGPRPRGRPRGSYKNVAAPRLGQVIMDDSDKREQDFFLSKLPDPMAEPPAQEKRPFGSELDSLDAVSKSSGGFRHFVRMLEDAAIIDIYQHVNSRYDFPEITTYDQKTKDAIQIVQCLRHMWNTLTYPTRVSFENGARKKAIEDHKNGVAKDDNEEVPSSLADLMNHVLGGDKKDQDGHAKMPPSEMPIRGASKSTPDMVVLDCCSDLILLKNFNDIKKHYMTKHYSGYLFACHFCNLLHESKEQLLKHSCTGFSEYMINRLVAGVVDDPQMTCAYMYLTCFECAFLLPLRDYKGERLDQAWNFFVTINNHHCGQSLRLLTVFSLEAIKEDTINGQAPSFYMNVLPRFKPLLTNCAECSVDFNTTEEANSHMLEHVQHACTKCGAQFGTETHLAHHQASHIPNKLLFARYIRDNLTVYPPVHVKNAMPRVGFAETDNVAFGGKEFTEENLFEFVNNEEKLIGEKMNNAIHAIPLEEMQEEMDGYSLKQGRHDVGLEEAEQLEQPSQEQVQLVDTMNKVFSKQIPDKRKLQWNARLHNMEKMKKAFCQEENGMDDDNEIVAKEVKCPVNYLMEDMIQKFTSNIKLPALACFDAVSEGLLTKDFDLCTKCNKIFEADGSFIHECSLENIVAVHRWQNGRRARLSCHLCEETFCSIFALRGHYAFDHLQSIDLATVKKNETLMTVAMENLKKGSRSTISKTTDAALHMEATKGLLRPKPTTGLQHMVPGRTVGVPRSTYQPRTYSNYRRGGIFGASSGRSSKPLIPPFAPATNRQGFTCKFCDITIQDMRKMREHLRVGHSHICRGCGHAFAYSEMVSDHSRKECSKVHINMPMGHVQGSCTICSKTLPVPRLYTHIFEDHLMMVAYGAEDGRIYVKDNGTPFVKNIYGAAGPPSVGRIIPSLTSNNSNLFSCYLCGFEFDTMVQLNDHLDRHPEKWTHCPFCPSVGIRSHDDFKSHLLSAHYTRMGNQMRCGVCALTLERNNIGHILYHCMMVKNCAICTDIRTELTGDDLRTHLKTAHPRIYNRYQCSECKMTDPQLQYIKTHTCKIYDMEHQCYCGEVLPTRSAFIDHFWCHIDSIKQTCKLCQMKFLNSGQTVASHRLTHSTIKGKASNRKTTILDEELFMGKTTKRSTDHFSKPIHTSRSASSIEVVDLDDDDEMDTADSPVVEEIIEEDIEEKIARNVVRQLVKDVCIELGEDAGEDEEDNALMANVRTESDDVTVVNQHPGYVDEDMECHSPSAPTTGTSVLREINEGNGDDDICVVAEVDHPQGSSQSTVVATTSRAKKYKCSKCSESFVTQASLVDHEIKSHRNDVGGICIKVYGAPTEGSHWVCRNCSILFENAAEHRNHMAAHGPSPGMSCPECSGFSYNTPLLVQHKNCHARMDKGRLLYGCGTCNKMFLTDSRLYDHLNNEHGVPLFFFCKGCSWCSYDVFTIAEHIQKSSICRTFLAKQGCKLNQMMGCFPANMVHFQPVNQHVFEMGLQRGSIKTVTPSECSHRSFLTPTDSVMSCKECHCTMPSVSFHANETYLNGGVPNPLPATIDESRKYPFLDISVLPNSNRNRRVDYYTQTVRGRPRTSGIPVLNSYPMSPSVYTANKAAATTRPPVAQVRPVGRPPGNSYGTRGRPSHWQTDMASRPVGRPTLSSTVPFTPPTPSNKCEVCNAAMSNSKVRRLHELHNSGQDWFCLNCATGQKTEMDAVSHAFVCGFNDERRAKLAGMADFRPLSFQLMCLFDPCRKKEQREYFNTLSELRNHINQNHSVALPFLSSCGQRFVNRDMMTRHETEHRKYEDLGIQTSCCNLCGVGNQWNQMTEICGHRTVISHMATHGLHAYSMCRGCFTCFPHDYDYSKTTKHFESTHTKPVAGGLIRCMFCDIAMKKTDLRNHVLDKHIVRGYKPRYNNNYQLIVRTNGVTRQFLGLSTDGFEEEAEPTASSRS